MGLGMLGTAIAGGLAGAGQVADEYIKEDVALNIAQRAAEIQAQRDATLAHWASQREERGYAREDARNKVTDTFERQKFEAERTDAAKELSLKERELSLRGKESPTDALAKMKLDFYNARPADKTSPAYQAWLEQGMDLGMFEKGDKPKRKRIVRDNMGNVIEEVTTTGEDSASDSEAAAPYKDPGLYDKITSNIGKVHADKAAQEAAGQQTNVDKKADSLKRALNTLETQKAGMKGVPKGSEAMADIDRRIDSIRGAISKLNTQR